MNTPPPKTDPGLALDGPNRILSLHQGESEAIASAAQKRERRIVDVALDGLTDKAQILDALAQRFDMPRWFGHNWDALYDCLTDLSWLPAKGYVLILTNAAPDTCAAPILTDLLTDCCEHWQDRGVPFHVFAQTARSADAA
ncbi:MAG TPA: barstar family protein [Denitromonas sp.]|uniref:barstar family protein n=1 Tax=Denitromonas sp. TaxID=2734609 RepID=UPI002BC226DE|nr:barstar family protein [Denitromonas sp.]HQU88347.1 barstar family protein [Denitromonas sp.]HQV13834.1 barstar family protein [Denitromonas sp.]